MRVGLVADVHSNLHAFAAVLRHFGRKIDIAHGPTGPCTCGQEHAAVDRVVHVGDLVGYAANPVEVVQLARQETTGGVLGNHDWAALREGYVPFNPSAYAGLEHTRRALGDEERKYLQALPLRQALDVPDVDVTLVHGSPADPLWEYVFPEEATRVLDLYARETSAAERPRMLVLGHTHVPVARALAPAIAGKPTRRGAKARTSAAPAPVPFATALVNPGSVGQPRDGDPRAACAVLDTATGLVETHRVPYDLHGAARAIRDAGLPVELGERLFYGR